MTGMKISGTGSYLPERTISNEGLGQLYSNINPDWIAKNLGILERRIADPAEQTSDIATNAARAALNDAGLEIGEIDLLIVATATPDRLAPSTASIVAEKLGMPAVIAFDISAVCSGFLFAMTTAAQFLATGAARRALIIGADIFSRITDWNKRDAGFFGDGAGAVVIEHRADGCAFYSDLRVIGGTEHFTVPRGQRCFSMDAPAVAKSASEALRPSVETLFDTAGVTADDVDLVIPHQPSVRLLQRVAKENGLNWDSFHLTMDRYANTAGATIPITLHDARESQRVSAGTRILFLSAGAGMSGGSALYTWH